MFAFFKYRNQTINFTEPEFIAIQIDEIKKLLDVVDSPIKSITGVSDSNASVLIGEIPNINNFDSPAKLVAFCGLDPVVKQSGKFNAPQTRMSKRGSNALINVAWQLSLNNDIFGKYYALKRNQGKKHYNALGHLATKLVLIIYKLLKDKTGFNPEYLK